MNNEGPTTLRRLLCLSFRAGLLLFQHFLFEADMCELDVLLPLPFPFCRRLTLPILPYTYNHTEHSTRQAEEGRRKENSRLVCGR